MKLITRIHRYMIHSAGSQVTPFAAVEAVSLGRTDRTGGVVLPMHGIRCLPLQLPHSHISSVEGIWLQRKISGGQLYG
jgi:hypothetical protein